MEIYCEEVRDLLAKDSSKKLAIRDHKDSGVYVEDLASFVVKNADDLDKIMTSGNRHREPLVPPHPEFGSSPCSILSCQAFSCFLLLLAYPLSAGARSPAIVLCRQDGTNGHE